MIAGCLNNVIKIISCWVGLDLVQRTLSAPQCSLYASDSTSVFLCPQQQVISEWPSTSICQPSHLLHYGVLLGVPSLALGQLAQVLEPFGSIFQFGVQPII